MNCQLNFPLKYNPSSLVECSSKMKYPSQKSSLISTKKGATSKPIQELLIKNVNAVVTLHPIYSPSSRAQDVKTFVPIVGIAS